MKKQNPKKILVAIAWPYVNGNLHVGHLAGYLLPADIFARFKRLKGDDVLMVSGSDCYGTPITVQADKEGISEKEVVDKYHKKDLDLLEKYDLSYNLYTKTTTENHKKVSQGVFLDLLKNGFISKGTMQQYYSPKDDEFLPDRYVEGTCPHCGAKEQRSDQCENCGRWLKDGELIDPLSKKTGEKVELKETEHYFLDLPKLQSQVEEYLNGKLDGKAKSKIWREWVYKETQGWLKEGLQKRAITRDLDWGVEIPVDRIPKDQLIDNVDNKRIYVWFEAVIGYLSAPQEWASLVSEKSNEYSYNRTDDYILRSYPGQSKDWEDWWLNKNTEIFNFMGQDNLVFHAIMWPAELIGTEKGYTLPENVVVNKFMNFNDAKFSKSRGNIIDSFEIAEEFGTDAVRYFVTSNFPENKEANFTWERFIDAVNSELVGNLGNLINRTLVFYKKNFSEELSGELDSKVLKEIETTFKKVDENISKVRLVEALANIMELSSLGNKYFNDSKIWEVIKTDQEKANPIMLNMINIIEALRILMRPFLPEGHQKLNKMLGIDENLEKIKVGKDQWKFSPIKGYEKLSEIMPLFEKLEKAEVLAKKTA